MWPWNSSEAGVISLLPPANLHMNLRHAANGVVHGEVLGGFEHVVLGFGVIAGRFVVEAEERCA
ncbi:MAG TPA: hypothetical protein DDZ88_09845 [Verrucomicrobiales bacterium]|nr:hypothetical protein [Verrucomicrobiales bacterium]